MLTPHVVSEESFVRNCDAELFWQHVTFISKGNEPAFPFLYFLEDF